jgi:hypothetical protein
VPVLLSMLVLIFASGGEDLTKLPANRLQLYTMATECAVRRRLQARARKAEEVTTVRADDEEEEDEEEFLHEAVTEGQKKDRRTAREKAMDAKKAKEAEAEGKGAEKKEGAEGAAEPTQGGGGGDKSKFVRRGTEKKAARGSAEAAPWRQGAKSATAIEMGSEMVGDGKGMVKSLLTPAEMYDSYALAARILDAVQKGASMRAKSAYRGTPTHRVAAASQRDVCASRLPQCMRSCPRGTSCARRSRRSSRGRTRASRTSNRWGWTCCDASPSRISSRGGESSRRGMWSRPSTVPFSRTQTITLKATIPGPSPSVYSPSPIPPLLCAHRPCPPLMLLFCSCQAIRRR